MSTATSVLSAGQDYSVNILFPEKYVSYFIYLVYSSSMIFETCSRFFASAGSVFMNEILPYTIIVSTKILLELLHYTTFRTLETCSPSGSKALHLSRDHGSPFSHFISACVTKSIR